MSPHTAATYLPDSQVITLGENLDAFSDPNNLRGFETAEQICFFFHEWLHYLHNVSTVHGLSAYANLVSLWSDFRHTTNETGVSSGSVALSTERALQVRQKQRYLKLTRTERTQKIPQKVVYHDFCIKEFSESEEKIEGTGVVITNIRCVVTIEEFGKPSIELNIEIGTHEILESAAWMLESKHCLALGSIATNPPVSPYQIVRKLAQHHIPDISDEVVIACLLCSLQDSNPPALLIDAFNVTKAAMEANMSPLAILKCYANETLSKHDAWIEKYLLQIENTFFVDEAMALAVKSTASTFRKNFCERMHDPFLEFGLIDVLKVNPAFMDNIIRQFGACALIQKRPGEIQQVQRDLIYEFAILGPTNPELQFGWRMMHSSFRYVTLHTSPDGFFATSDIEQNESSKRCPFFTACDLKLRIESPEICAHTPWRTASMPESEERACWYRAGVVAVKPAP